MSTLVCLIGGFLGAGKTTLLAAAARRLLAAGRRVAVITNDQAPELVDSALLRHAGLPVGEVPGACLCCAYGDFLARLRALAAEHRPEVVLAEPVGSCVDLAATVLRPLAREGAGWRIAPLTVCVDPAAWRAGELGALPPDTLYIVRQQVAEADLLLLTKDDACDPRLVELAAAGVTARNPAAPWFRVSARSGSGLDDWLAALARGEGGGRRIEVDYETYAAGEAALGWLNASVALRGETDWVGFLERFAADLVQHCRAAGAAPAHLKLWLTAGSLAAVANAVAGRERPEVRRLAEGHAEAAQLIINARVALAPERLRAAVARTLEGHAAVVGRLGGLRAFSPARPVPQHRLP